MCGIAGILSTQGPTELGTITATLSRLLEHRGPDDHGWLLLGPEGVQRGRQRPPARPANLMLLHRRLSILDLTEAGWQPMTTPDEQHFIVFNGETYNFPELRDPAVAYRTHSDTEVLMRGLAAEGAKFLDKLDGMFAFAYLDKRRGKIIHQSSTAAYLGNVGMVDTEDPDLPMPPFHYSVAKIGVAGLTKYMAGALGPWGINVNAIAPGVTMTEATKKIVPDGILQSLVMFSALRKALEPEDLTGAAVFLASDDSNMMTGQTLVVDGGMVMLG